MRRGLDTSSIPKLIKVRAKLIIAIQNPAGFCIAMISFALTLINFGIDEVSNPRLISERLWRNKVPKNKITHGITPVSNSNE